MIRPVSIALLLAGLLSGCGLSQEQPQNVDPLAGGRYVAMGSSMAAGPGLGPPKPGTPPRCTRAFANYPTLLAERLKLTLVDQTCSGATTAHILGPWGELPAQADAITPDTSLVTVTIGGNDLNYVGGLIAAGCSPDGMISIAGRTFPCPPRREPGENDFAKAEANLREVANVVKTRAPKATLAFVEYLRLVPHNLCAATPISEEDAAVGRAIADRLAQITARVAKETGSLLVPIHTLSKTHTPCDDEPWAVGNPPGYDGSDGAPWHPNAAGMRAVANETARLLMRR